MDGRAETLWHPNGSTSLVNDPILTERILGHIKDAIRRSGENISAVEVESVLGAMPGIVEAVALPVADAMRGAEVKVCVTLCTDLSPADLPPEAILSFCRERLARFKVPRYIAYLAELPKTPSGKIAKQALRPPAADLRLASFDAAEDRWR